MIKVQSLNSSTDVSGLAKEVILQCKLIPSSRVNEVQQLLSYLQQRPDKAEKSSRLTTNHMKNDDLNDILCQTDEEASIGKIESYIELLYEEVERKISGTSLILQLARQSENLQDLSQNEALIGVLYRVLREDGRRHFALAINITFIFFCLASYSTFHQVLTRFKVGSLLMEIIRWELQRFEQWDSELKSGHYDEGQLHLPHLLFFYFLLIEFFYFFYFIFIISNFNFNSNFRWTTSKDSNCSSAANFVDPHKLLHSFPSLRRS